MKKLFVLLLMTFATNSFATGIGGGTSAPCDNDTLNKYSGTANVEINWEPNVIGLTWYDGDTQVAGPDSCVYDGTITVPPQPTKLGYTFKGWKVVGLPAGYTRLEYIETSGTQQIDTGIMSNGIGLKADVQIKLTDATPEERAIIGVKNNCNTYEIYFSSGGKYISAWRTSGQAVNVPVNYTTGVLYRIISEMTSNSITLDINGNQGTFSGTLSPMYTYEITLFRLCGKYAIYARLYSAKMWLNGSLVRDFIPAKNSSNVIGLYDMVSKTFFTNTGTGSFIAGPVVQ